MWVSHPCVSGCMTNGARAMAPTPPQRRPALGPRPHRREQTWRSVRAKNKSLEVIMVGHVWRLHECMLRRVDA